MTNSCERWLACWAIIFIKCIWNLPLKISDRNSEHSFKISKAHQYGKISRTSHLLWKMALKWRMMWKCIHELWTHLVRGGNRSQRVCVLPASGIQMVGVPQTVEHLCYLLHPLLLHRHILTPFGNELAGLTRKQRSLHETGHRQMHTVRRCTQVYLLVRGKSSDGENWSIARLVSILSGCESETRLAVRWQELYSYHNICHCCKYK